MLAMAEETYSPQVAAVLNKLGLDDVIAREHYIRHPSGHMDLLGSKSGWHPSATTPILAVASETGPPA